MATGKSRHYSDHRKKTGGSKNGSVKKWHRLDEKGFEALSDAEKKFINPYNFVRLNASNEVDGEKGIPSRAATDERGSLSGFFKCRLIVKTPLAMPDSSFFSEEMTKGKVHKVAPFLSKDTPDNNGHSQCAYSNGLPSIPHQGRPIIPGSEIRGVIRTAYETLDDGCLFGDGSQALSARSSASRQPGLVRHDPNEGWQIRAAEKDNKRPKGSATERKWFSANANKPKPTTAWFSGECEWKPLAAAAVQNYRDNVEEYRKHGDKNGGTFSKEEDDGERTLSLAKSNSAKPKTDHPVFFQTIRGKDGTSHTYLSPAQISRSVFYNTIDDLIGPYARCKSAKHACGTCRLFGMVEQQQGYGAIASKLRFGDAAFVGDFDAHEHTTQTTLKELGSPKLSSVEMYTNRPEGAKSWTFDAKVRGYKKDSTPISELLVEDETITIRGRKYYLHHFVDTEGLSGNDADRYTDEAIIKSCKLEENATEDKKKRCLTTNLVRTGCVFEFKVFFDSISQEQLEKLHWALTAGENDVQSMQMYKFGHGKPLGLGSAKIVVDSTCVRSCNSVSDGYRIQQWTPKGYECPFEHETDSFKDFMTLTRFDLLRGRTCEITYPQACDATENDAEKRNAGYQWFVANRVCKGSGVKWHIDQTLPKMNHANGDIRPQDLEMVAYRKTEDRKASAQPSPRSKTLKQAQHQSKCDFPNRTESRPRLAKDRKLADKTTWHEGVIGEANAGRGFSFIHFENMRIFAHIKNFRGRPTHVPDCGTRVKFKIQMSTEKGYENDLAAFDITIQDED